MIKELKPVVVAEALSLDLENVPDLFLYYMVASFWIVLMPQLGGGSSKGSV